MFNSIFLRTKKAQGLTEYVLIIALIALIAVGSMQLFGGKIKERFDTLSDVVSQGN